MIGKRLVNTGEPAPFDPLQNFETVTYTGNGSTQKITGYIRKGAAFNGSSSAITFPQIYSSAHTNSNSVSLWFKTNTNDGNLRTIIDPFTAPGWILYTINGVIRFAYYDLPVSGITDGSTNIADGLWHNLVVSLDNPNGQVKVYLDGNSTAEITHNFTANTSVVSFTSNWHIGKINNNVRYFNGSIDQVRVFNKAISGSEVTTLYNETYDSSTKSTTDIFGDGSGIALYELDEDANSSNFEQAAVFNGSSSAITTSLDFSTLTDYSISMWLNPSQANSNFFGGTINSSALNGIYFAVNTNSTIRYYERDGSTSATQLNSTDTITLNSWNHIVFVRSGGTNYVYVNNGTPASLSNSTITHSAGFTLGRGGSYTASNLYEGKIDQVRIYETALSSGDVTKLYKESADVPTSNLVAHYKLDGNATDETETYDGAETSITYSAGVYGGTFTNVNFLGMAFQPDLVWIKKRSGAQVHNLYDSVRGVSKVIYSDLTNAEATVSSISSFDTNGITLGNGGGDTNASNETYVAWSWKAADTTTTISAGTVGNDDASNVRANQDAGFSIVEWSSSGGARTVAHGLNSAPELIIIKKTTTTSPWSVYVSVVGNNKRLQLNENAAAALDNIWGNTDPTNQVFTQQISASATTDNIAYCFHSVNGYQKVGSYSYNPSGDKRVYTTSDGTSTGTGGFQPRWVMIKKTNDISNWVTLDSIRVSGNLDGSLSANTSNAENITADRIEFHSDGFTVIGSNTATNTGNHIYLAIA